MPDLSDQTLVARCINGERLAWDEFVERFSQLIFWAIHRRLKRTNYRYSRQDVEDIFQDVFVLLWEKEKLRQVRMRDSICAWLGMVAANCALNHFRNKRKELVKENLALEKTESGDSSAVETVELNRLHEILEKAFDCLCARDRIILKLNYLYDKTHQEIGELLKIPANTVSSVIKRNKERLKEELRKLGWENF